jgi:hypothetical protein
VLQADCIDQKYEIIVKILTKLTEKRQNIHTMGRFSEKQGWNILKTTYLLCGRGLLKTSINRLGRNNCLEKDPYKSTVCRSLFKKIGIASDRIDEMKRSKDQKLSISNLLTLRTIYKFFKSHFPEPYRFFWRICLQNLVFEISCVGEDLAGFQKLLFWTPDITPHPSLVLVFHVIFVKPKTASREPWLIDLGFWFCHDSWAIIFLDFKWLEEFCSLCLIFKLK